MSGKMFSRALFVLDIPDGTKGYPIISPLIVVFQMLLEVLVQPVPQNKVDWITPHEAIEFGIMPDTDRDTDYTVVNTAQRIEPSPDRVQSVPKPSPVGDFVFPTEETVDTDDDDKISKLAIASILG